MENFLNTIQYNLSFRIGFLSFSLIPVIFALCVHSFLSTHCDCFFSSSIRNDDGRSSVAIRIIIYIQESIEEASTRQNYSIYTHIYLAHTALEFRAGL